MPSQSLLSSLRAVGAAVFAASALLLAPAPPANADDCQFILGFATMHELLPYVVGQCVDNEQHNPVSGDGLQHTMTLQGGPGLLVWRMADNWTAFTDGYCTWVNGPHGLDYRLNTQRFAWETNPQGLPVVPDAHVGPAPALAPTGPTLQLDSVSGVSGSGPLVFHVSGRGFDPDEVVSVQGSYTPVFLLLTGDATAPAVRQTCTPQMLGPIEVSADDAGNFTAALEAPRNVLTPFDAKISARGVDGDQATAGTGGGTMHQFSFVPAGCLSCAAHVRK